MARIAVIDGTTVVNVIEASPDYALDGFILVPSDVAGPGWTYAKGKFSPPAAPPDPVPSVISTRQFFQQLAIDGDCTKADALAYVRTGALPKTLADVIATLPDDAQFDVSMKVIGANEFNRTDPAVSQLGVLLQKDSAALDRIWRLASAL